ncbi:MAG: CinA family protein [Chloroflexota bacterium]|jgi:PncC family amidohydrolase
MELPALASRLQAVALERGLTVATAESCTGGLVGHSLTAIAGSSDYYLGGVISYSNELKVRLLGVPEPTLGRHGAVSAQVAVAMADGARTRAGSDYAVAVTGVAGPGGGTGAKPVGLTYVAVAGPNGHEVRRHQWEGDRAANKEQSAAAALELLLEVLVGDDR